MKDPLEKVLKAGVFIVFAALVLVVTFQVFSRIFFPNLSQIWTEEVTRFLFIYSISLAAPVAMKQKAYVNIDLINKLPAKLLIPIKILVEVLILILFIVIFYYGIKFTMLGTTQRAPTIKIPIAIVFVSIPVMGAFMTFYSAANFVKFLKYLKAGGDVKSWS
ncbi:MAG: TRAP transporter small permease [Spirochaetales bacterium]|nr:TRAP transporter small permease [Spirochaetales bacterium]